MGVSLQVYNENASRRCGIVVHYLLSSMPMLICGTCPNWFASNRENCHITIPLFCRGFFGTQELFCPGLRQTQTPLQGDISGTIEASVHVPVPFSQIQTQQRVKFLTSAQRDLATETNLTFWWQWGFIETFWFNVSNSQTASIYWKMTHEGTDKECPPVQRQKSSEPKTAEMCSTSFSVVLGVCWCQVPNEL